MNLQSQLEAKKAEKAALEQSHAGLVESAKAQQQQFNQMVAANQQKFHELSGAINILEDLVNETLTTPGQTSEQTGNG